MRGTLTAITAFSDAAGFADSDLPGLTSVLASVLAAALLAAGFFAAAFLGVGFLAAAFFAAGFLAAEGFATFASAT